MQNSKVLFLPPICTCSGSLLCQWRHPESPHNSNLLPEAAQNLFILPLGHHCHSPSPCLPAPLTASGASFPRWNPMIPRALPMPLAKAVDGLHSCVASMRDSAQIFFLLPSLHAIPTFLPISSDASVSLLLLCYCAFSIGSFTMAATELNTGSLMLPTLILSGALFGSTNIYPAPSITYRTLHVVGVLTESGNSE